jgi:hypothetical protein
MTNRTWLLAPEILTSTRWVPARFRVWQLSPFKDGDIGIMRQPIQQRYDTGGIGKK